MWLAFSSTIAFGRLENILHAPGPPPIIATAVAAAITDVRIAEGKQISFGKIEPPVYFFETV